jgi:hypothetical protein
MRLVTLLVLVLGMTAVAFAAPQTTNVYQYAQKPMGVEYQNPTARVTGDTTGDPFICGALPFTANGTTVGFANDYDYACPYTGSTSPDVVYKFTAANNNPITVDLCASVYDTKVYVYNSSMAVIACNDDFCSFQSKVSNVPVTAGGIYYIIIDGYGGSAGSYNMVVTEYQPCTLECAPGAMLEGEPVCYDGYDDIYNGGCNTVPFPVFQILEPNCNGITICGTTGVFPMDTLMYRDTDWFQMDITTTSYICLGGDSEIPSYFFIIDGRGGCSASVVVAYGIAGPCAPISDICYTCDPGTWWAWSGPSAWDTSYLCGSLYNLTIDGYCGVTPAESTTWGTIKNLFN